LYSDRYREVTRSTELLGFSWLCAETGQQNLDKARDLLDSMSDYWELEATARLEFGPEDMQLPAAPLMEILFPSGQRAFNAVNIAAEMFKMRINWAIRNPNDICSWRMTQFFKSSAYDPQTYVHNDPFSAALEIEFYRYSRETFNVALHSTGLPTKGMFDHILLVIPQAVFDEPPDEEHFIPIPERGMPVLPAGVVWHEPRVIYRGEAKPNQQ
jgi:hypothetical protein